MIFMAESTNGLPAAGHYRTPDEFLEDVLLIFNNARTYNKPGSDVHVMANTIQVRAGLTRVTDQSSIGWASLGKELAVRGILWDIV